MAEEMSWQPDEFERCPSEIPTSWPAEVQALAEAAERCGQPGFSWIADRSLGDVLAEENVRVYTAAEIANLAQNVDFPIPLRFDVRVSVVEYTTQDRGEFVKATSLVAAPVPQELSLHGYQNLLFLHGTAGFSDSCAPSLDENARILLLASSGFVVTAPDYLGLKAFGDPSPEIHPYLVGQSVALTSLDALRATWKLILQNDDVCLSGDVAIFGGSQGGHAALWVDRLLPYYAPEFELLGTAVNVVPADLFSEIQRAYASPTQATANGTAFLTANAFWYGFEDRLDEFLVPPLDTDFPEAMRTQCEPWSALDTGGGQGSIFQQAFLDAVPDLENDPLWGCVALENGLTTTSIPRLNSSPSYADTYGILWVMGEDDRLVNTPIQRAAFEELCGQGMTKMRWIECEGASHGSAAGQALPEIVRFLYDSRTLAPFPTVGACEVTPPQDCTQL